MRQRAALARALVGEPEILLMDEPFGALDSQTCELLHAELESIWQSTKKTIVFVTHNVREAVRLGDRVVVMGTRDAVGRLLDGTRPGRIKRVIEVELSRPRDQEQRDVGLLASVIRAELRAEIEKVTRDEVDEGWKLSEGPAKADPDRDIGGGI